LEVASTRRRDELAHLISSDRVLFRTAALVAYHACVYGVKVADESWLSGLVERCIQNLLREDEQADRSGEPVEDEDVYAYQVVMELLDVSAEDARHVCVEFNALPFESRAAYFQYSRECAALADLTLETDVSPEQLRADLARALRRLLGGDE
jgi:hypothetical protein